MGKKNTTQAIKREIDKINERIDIKIAKGQKYKKEAEQHRKLVKKYNEIVYGRAVTYL